MVAVFRSFEPSPTATWPSPSYRYRCKIDRPSPLIVTTAGSSPMKGMSKYTDAPAGAVDILDIGPPTRPAASTLVKLGATTRANARISTSRFIVHLLLQSSV